MKTNNPSSNHQDGQAVIEASARQELLWGSAKLLASMAFALAAAICIDGLLAQI